LAPSDQVELLFLLSRDSDGEVSGQAETSLQSMEEASLVTVLKEPSAPPDVLAFFGESASSDEVHQAIVRNAATPDETVCILVPRLTETNLEFVVVNQTRLLRHTAIIEALEGNENLSLDQQRRIDELKHDFKLDGSAAAPSTPEAEPAPVQPVQVEKIDLSAGPAEEEEAPPESEEEAAELYGAMESEDGELTEEEAAKRKSIISQIVRMTAAEKMMLGLKGEREARLMLIRDRNRTVWSAVLSSPKMNDADAEQIAKMRNVAPDVLRAISNNRQWTKRYSISHELVKNPKTPPEVSSKLLVRLKDRDLKRLLRDRNVPEQVRRLAKKRTHASK